MEQHSLTPDETFVEKYTSWFLLIASILLLLSFVAAIGTLSYSIVRERERAKETRAQVDQNERTIRVLCDRGWLLDGITLALIDYINDPPNRPADAIAVARLNVYRSALVDQLTEEGSPCVRG